MPDLIFPNNREQVAIVGQNGSGKTVFAAHILSKAHYLRQPYVIVDYKGDDLLRSIQYVRQIGLNEIPRHPGIYRVQPRIHDDDEAFSNWAKAVHRRRHVGLYFDEGYMLPKAPIITALYTQGRQLRIPIITLSQRPVLVNRFAFSEAYYHAVFFLSDDRDIETVRSYVPKSVFESDAPRHCCAWYDVPNRALFNLGMCPHPDEIRERIESSLRPKRRAI